MADKPPKVRTPGSNYDGTTDYSKANEDKYKESEINPGGLGAAAAAAAAKRKKEAEKQAEEAKKAGQKKALKEEEKPEEKPKK